MNKNKQLISFVVLAILVIAIIIILNFFSLQEIVEVIGIRNSYILAFLVSLFGGFSAGGSVSFISLLIILASGGMEPISLGLTAGSALAIGDIVMFHIGLRGRELITGKWHHKINKVANVFEKRKSLYGLIPFFTYMYIGFLPLPNDILILFLAAIEYPPKKINIAIILSSLTFATMIALLASQGIFLNLYF